MVESCARLVGNKLHRGNLMNQRKTYHWGEYKIPFEKRKMEKEHPRVCASSGVAQTQPKKEAKKMKPATTSAPENSQNLTDKGRGWPIRFQTHSTDLGGPPRASHPSAGLGSASKRPRASRTAAGQSMAKDHLPKETWAAYFGHLRLDEEGVRGGLLQAT